MNYASLSKFLNLSILGYNPSKLEKGTIWSPEPTSTDPAQQDRPKVKCKLRLFIIIQTRFHLKCQTDFFWLIFCPLDPALSSA